jgi:hypothetical protein
MEQTTRHQCVIYDGAPSKMLPHLAVVARQRLNKNYRCMFLNSPALVAGVRCYLAAAGIDVVQEIAQGSLLLSSSQSHLVNGHFDVESMLRGLEEAVEQALRDGYKGLWATGDMTWEFGPQKDFTKLLEYEWRLEQLFRKQPALCGICQYHQEMLPREALQVGSLLHESIFVSETLSRINPSYLRAENLNDLRAQVAVR